MRGAWYSPLRRWKGPILVFVVCLGVYLPVGRSGGSGDTLPARLVAISLLTEGDFDLDEFRFAYDEAAVARFPQMGGVPYYLRKSGKHFYSAYTVAPSVLALPVFAPFVLLRTDPASPRAAFAEKLAASLMVALSAAVLFALLRRRLGPGWTLFLTFVYAFGTSAFATSSQALWQHGPGQLCLALAALWADPEGRPRPVLSALAIGASVAMRSTNVLAAAPLGAWLLWRHRERWWKIASAAAAGPVLLAAYYLAVFGAPGAESESIRMGLTSGFRQIPLSEGLWGVLLSPVRGLFFHSPVLILALAGGFVAVRRRDAFLAVLLAGALAIVPVVAKWIVWWGGHCFGPRLLADTMPMWVLALAPALRLARWPGALIRAAAIGLGSLSIGIGALGAALYDGGHDAFAYTDLAYENMLRSGGGPTAFYASGLLKSLGLHRVKVTDLGPPPHDPTLGADGKPLPRLGGDQASGEQFLRAVLSTPVMARADRPTIEIGFRDASLSRKDRLEAEIRTLNPGRPRAMNAWVVIEDASGRLWYLQGDNSFVPAGPAPPKPWTGNSPLPYDVRVELSAPLPSLPSGRHNLYFAITDYASTRVVARTRGIFETGP